MSHPGAMLGPWFGAGRIAPPVRHMPYRGVPPAMSSRRQDQLRHEGPLFGEKRRALIEACDTLLAEIDSVDSELAELAARRRRLVVELRKRRTRLLPARLKAPLGRQPVPDGSVRLPPVRRDSTPLWGRRLRQACVAVLRRTGALALPELHALLHHHGFRVDHVNPVKALADALAYESEVGRAERLERGVYGPCGKEPWPTPSGPGTRLDHLPDAVVPWAA